MHHAKAILASVAGLVIIGLQSVQAVSADGAMTVADWITVAIAVLGPLIVYKVPNAPQKTRDSSPN